MNEKEKARELVREYLIAVYDDGQPFDKMLHLHKTEVKVPAIQRAKQCALIAVRREINSFKQFFAEHYSKTIDMDITIAFSAHIKMLEGVINEIEKL